MMSNTAIKTKTLFELPHHQCTILADQYANIFWTTERSDIKPLSEMPWELQAPFYLTFLHDDRLAERFKDYEILGAIDIYIKSAYFNGKDLNLSH